jgi:ribosomal protein L11 methyltransferase
MNTIQLTIPTNNTQLQEIVIAQLSEIGFESFEETAQYVKACVPENIFHEAEAAQILQQLNLQYSKEVIAPQNWNALWESNFSPILVNDFVGIRANFHESLQGVKHEIIITPKMSFGTGHHATTYMMIQLMEQVEFTAKTVFDFGTGTGILAIVAEKLGANHILAVDNDDWCIENATENISINNCNHIVVEKNHTAQTEQVFAVVMANINKHIIEANFAHLTTALQQQGSLLLSGLLESDEADILTLAKTYHLQHQQTLHQQQWIAMQFTLPT